MKTNDMEQNKEYTTEDVVLEDNQLICALTKKIKTANEKELTLQSMIMMLNEEYNFDLKDMERDFPFSYEDDQGKTKRAKADLAVFEPGRAHDADNMIRIAIVFDSKVKDKDLKKEFLKRWVFIWNLPNVSLVYGQTETTCIIFNAQEMLLGNRKPVIFPIFPVKDSQWKIWNYRESEHTHVNRQMIL
jgi:hypothetical protein